MPSLFRRKTTELIPDELDTVTAERAPARSRGYTPSKRELGKVTPRRPSSQPRKAEAPPKDKREATRWRRERARAQRAEQRAGMLAGDERYLLPRDRGPERALTRDVVDSRRTIGTWFFGGALVVLIGSSAAMPPVVQLASNVLWVLLAAATVLDSVLICRRVRQLVRSRYPRTEQRMGSLYSYAVMRALTFRRMRMPKPRVALGASI